MRKYIVNLILMFLPSSRVFGFKRWLLRMAGCKVSPKVRVMRIRVNGVNVAIGEDTFIGDETFLMGGNDSWIHIGRDCDISSRVGIITGTHEFNPSSEVKAAGKGYSRDITIGDGVWIGFGALILPGVEIGSGAMVAAGAVVTKNVPRMAVVAGVPARVLYIRNQHEA